MPDVPPLARTLAGEGDDVKADLRFARLVCRLRGHRRIWSVPFHRPDVRVYCKRCGMEFPDQARDWDAKIVRRP